MHQKIRQEFPNNVPWLVEDENTDLREVLKICTFQLPVTVHAVLSGFNKKKVHGSDAVPPVVLKNCASELTPCLGKLFRLCLSSNTFPSSWKYALIQPVLKKSDRSLLSNYRPIALISNVSKILESIIEKILEYFSTYNLLSDKQYGFL